MDANRLICKLIDLDSVNVGGQIGVRCACATALSSGKRQQMAAESGSDKVGGL